jgi:dipeptide/tripeptide permease
LVTTQSPEPVLLTAPKASSVTHEKGLGIEISETNEPSNSQFPEPTEEEAITLRKIAGSIPWVAWLLCLVEFAERASYYGAKQVFVNFLQKPLPEGSTTGAPLHKSSEKNVSAGALGKGLPFANAFVLLFNFLSYAIPIYGAWLGDTKTGRYTAIFIGVIICGVAHIVQIFGALPTVLVKGQGLAPFLISLLLLAIGAGNTKP